MHRVILALPLVLAPAMAGAFPANGTYYGTCAETGGPAEGAVEATLEFPELCFDGACCALYNPTRLRGLDEDFLYDGNCEEDGAEFEARLFFGEGPSAESMVVVLRGLGETLYSCPEPAQAATPPSEADLADPAPDPSEADLEETQ